MEKAAVYANEVRGIPGREIISWCEAYSTHVIRSQSCTWGLCNSAVVCSPAAGLTKHCEEDRAGRVTFS